MDVLSDVMRAVRLNGAVFFDLQAGEPFVAETPHMRKVGHRLMPDAAHVIPFHIMMRGQCWVESINGHEPPASFKEGDVVFYPHGDGHVFVSRLGARTSPNLDAFRRRGQMLPILLNLAEHGPPSLRMVCGYLACDKAPFNPLIEALPSQVLARRPEAGNHLEVDLIYSAVAESETHRAGSEAILARLSELLFVGVLRRYIDSLPEHSEGWLAGLRDPNVGRALQLIHGEPARDWSLEDLARESGMSRSIFADRFLRCVGETPMRYLAKWRMQLATHLLTQPGTAVEAVAEQVGYRSEAAFSRAFKGIVGKPPGAWRRAQTSAH